MISMGCCGGGCTIFSDDYATDNLATNYSQRSGSWTVGSGVLSTTSSSALLRCETAVTAGLTAVYSSVDCTPATNSDAGRLIIAYTDDNNFWYAEVQPGTPGTLKIFQVSGGVHTQRNTTANFSGGNFTAGSTVTICCASRDGGLITTNAGVVGSPGVHAYNNYDPGPATIASTKCGLGTGSGSSSVTFDNFLISKERTADEACPYCLGTPPCTNCDGNTPPRLQVTLSGIGESGITPCGDCATLNGTYILDYVTLTGTPSCVWEYLLDPQPCDGAPAPDHGPFLRIVAELQAGGVFQVYIEDSGSGGIDAKILWRDSSFTPGVCADWVDVELPWTSQAAGGCASAGHESAFVSAL